MEKQRVTTAQIRAAMRLHFSSPQWVMLEEVRNETGRLKKKNGKQPRYADMLAMSLWPSMGLEIWGFEIKISRADWLKELSDEKKSVPVAQFCDRWFLVTHNPDIVKEGELPDGWGLIQVTGADVKIIKECQKREASQISREFLASLLRNATMSNLSTLDVETQVDLARVAKPIDRKLRSRKRTGLKAATARAEKRSLANMMMQG